MQTFAFKRVFTAMVASLLVVGTCGYVLIEGWPLIDAIFMTVITLSTVGYGETQELSHGGRIFTSILIGVSMVCMACWTAGITSFFVSADVKDTFRKQKERKMISQMSGHTVVCGGGVTARTIIDQLVRQNKQVVAIVDDQDEMQLLKRLHAEVPIIQGDPKSEFALADANALAASFLIAAVEADFDNLLITITGKGMGTNIKVISFAQSTELASRMFKVGADEVICPFVLGGEKAANLIG